jgi:hypothetical protein
MQRVYFHFRPLDGQETTVVLRCPPECTVKSAFELWAAKVDEAHPDRASVRSRFEFRLVTLAGEKLKPSRPVADLEDVCLVSCSSDTHYLHVRTRFSPTQGSDIVVLASPLPTAAAPTAAGKPPSAIEIPRSTSSIAAAPPRASASSVAAMRALCAQVSLGIDII